MFTVLRADLRSLFDYGPFKIRRIHPGQILPAGDNDAFGPLSVIDHVNLGVGAQISLHEHRNDEIFTYIWQGSMVHEESDGQRTPLSPKKLMMINAGQSFWHQESTPIVPAEVLQIYIRPGQADLPARIQFVSRPEGIATNQWTLLAGPEGQSAPLEIRQQLFIYDIRLDHQSQSPVPQQEGLAQWLYVMDGEVAIGGHVLYKGDAIASENLALPVVTSTGNSTLLCFCVDLAANVVTDGTVSGL
ncbi:MAG: pirin family protein [Rouxiella aceris]|jgi:redox-sensitive bicupin YhaK (pirin superfamily)|uniref:Pirin N-terminal domain-containing protein n=1 Tax=Rouxiella aceris TaxID=2703884 RepID=A0A848MQA4_9GAMM|nr:pirin family protein [Rouxiella aceris]MDR3434160.1 pirin family protein [Rouxiella aceris]NMP29326.1 hypothetical protein [Rouxiella aceris]